MPLAVILSFVRPELMELTATAGVQSSAVFPVAVPRIWNGTDVRVGDCHGSASATAVRRIHHAAGAAPTPAGGSENSGSSHAGHRRRGAAGAAARSGRVPRTPDPGRREHALGCQSQMDSTQLRLCSILQHCLSVHASDGINSSLI